MMVVSSYLPFPSIIWWARAIDATVLMLDGAEHFEKMTARNKYRIAGANNPIQLSIPITGGREQRTAMNNVTIFNGEKWQVQHWRTLTSVYRQSPFWEFYEPSLQPLYTGYFEKLADFNEASVTWCMQQLKLTIDVQKTSEYRAIYPPPAADTRKLKPLNGQRGDGFPKYYQLFEDRTGFLPDLSILDLLFAEGPHTAAWLRSNKDILLSL